jgi:Tol biopolymer transport system component
VKRLSTLVLLALAGALVLSALVEAAAKTRRVSVSSSEQQANASSGDVAISASGRFVVFHSGATNLVAHDTNGVTDVFVRDRKTGLTRRVSVATGGAQANGFSGDAKISANGRFVVFNSDATNLVPNDTNNRQDVFIRDLKTKTTRRISVSSAGEQADDGSADGSISADGRFVAFESDATNLIASDGNGFRDIFLRDRRTKTTRRISNGIGGVESNGDSTICDGYAPAISNDGTFVAFESGATNLVGSDTNARADVFVRNWRTRKTRLASVSTGGAQANQGGSSYCAISGGGSLVVFESDSTNLVGHDTNAETDVFVRNWRKHKTTRVNVTSSGVQSTEWGGYSGISGNGRFVFFQGPDSNLAPGDTNGFDDIYIHDRRTGTTRLATPGKTGGPNGNGYGAISADGRFLAFESAMTDLAPHDTNGFVDIYVRGPFRWPR